MYGYIFETTNKKTGEKYIGKRFAVTFDKNYFGEAEDEKLAVAIEKYGRPSFEAKMLMPFESADALESVFAEMKKPAKKEEKKIEEEVPKAEEPEVKPARGRKKKTAEEE